MTVAYINEFEHINLVKIASKKKILTIDNNYAEIYCVHTAKYKDDSYKNGSIYSFEKKNNEWVSLEPFNCIWSERGTADGFIWPYFR